MSNAITTWDENTPDVRFQTAPVTFNAFDYYKGRCEQIAAYIKGIEVTEDNVQAVKKDLAAARKITDGLNSRKVQIKKAILADYRSIPFRFPRRGQEKRWQHRGDLLE